MAEAVVTVDGWSALHDTRQFDWTSWKLISKEERQAAIDEFQQLISKWEAVEEEKQGSHGVYKVVGNKADFMFIFLRESFEELEQIKTEINKTKLGDFLIPGYSYVSIIEMTMHDPMKAGEDRELSPYVKDRLKPIMPKWEHACFYPMARRRDPGANWFEIEKEERTKLLYEHGMTGRKYAGKVKEIITGSIGLDEWEWGVTLFAHDPLQFKKIVYEMRFDEVTTKYAEFGDFIVGNFLEKEELSIQLSI
ncbi:heme-dependent peroxidase [Oceanobacillus kimchii]|uniref:Coproheme decarboxylase n=1 Tax=Oceanobacillus kimchii TaxID=746691 RepID=A0ABQ5TPI1_9BACI|nr:MULTISPECIES: hydrogen peroxide-dependent heme synthase [Oceanobacillus]MBT2599487.1 heme-dependent peroxidase [Oceanobacillus sp. ISL-74]MCT1576673.1 heme-dependent peroxidase [Oceanobacillus kimchii]MCT2134743.1 heme-dependent peroxidase [Oceanobacillus kimchii]OEH56042.1 heme-binding protein [Oceanobacillus sp. E9]GLO67709.1 putative heme-dependent peroxidase [Oceanobacillus kimchii]